MAETKCAYAIELVMRFREHQGIIGIACISCKYGEKLQNGGQCAFYRPEGFEWNPEEVAMLKTGQINWDDVEIERPYEGENNG